MTPPTRPSCGLGPDLMTLILVEVRPGGPQADGDDYSDCDGRAVTLSRHRASSVVLHRGPCAALDEAPPVEPPERTSGTGMGSRDGRT